MVSKQILVTKSEKIRRQNTKRSEEAIEQKEQ